VCLAQHLAVVEGGCTPFAPCGDMVGIHLRQLVDTATVATLRETAQWAVGAALCFGVP
jgi:hypothetical protein